MPLNRRPSARWTVDAIHRDGALTVTGRRGQVRLPAEYVAEYVELAYAQTSHASQGRTVDHSFLVLDGPTNAAGIYVPMTRGRETNEAFVTLRGEETPVDVVSEALTRTWIDRPAIAVRAELPRPSDDQRRQDEPARPLPARELRRCLDRVGELNTEIQRIGFERRREVDAAAAALADKQRAEGELKWLLAQLANAERKIAELDRPLHRLRHRDELNRARELAERLPAETKEQRREIDALSRHARSLSDPGRLVERLRNGKESQMSNELAELKHDLADDALVRGAAGDLDQIVAGHVGPMPADPSGRELWLEAAGRLAQHRQGFDVTSTDPLGDRRRVFDDCGYAASRHAAEEALKRLDRVLGMALAVERPRLSRGLSL